jgi:uncharacterized protein (TIRG00374 family)
MKSFAIKFFLTLIVFAIILWQVNIDAAFARFALLSPVTMAICLLIALLQIAMLSYRWSLVGRLTGLTVPFAELLRCTLASQFFSQGLPASVGGDALRIWWLGRAGFSIGKAAYNVLVDRLSGFLALLVVSLASLPLLFALVGSPVLTLSVAITVAIAFAGALLAASPFGRRLTIIVFKIMQRATGRENLGRGLMHWLLSLQRAAAKLFLLSKGGIVLMWGLLIHIATIGLCVVIADGAGIPLSTLGAFAVVPGVLLLSYLPISVGGWGVREGGMALALGLVGVPASDAVFIGLALGAVGLIAALLGALVWLVTPMPISLLGKRL